MEDLVKEIRRHNWNYWEAGESEISDEEYDKLINELKAIDPAHELVVGINTPSVNGGGKVEHTVPMLSLDKAYSKEEIIDWCKKRARDENEIFIIQPKYDGISANYEDGILSTRGDGNVGENITDKLPLVEFAACSPFDGGMRGEIVITDSDFENIYTNIKRKGGGVYKNSRNAVAGVMNLKDITSVQEQGAKVTFVPFDLYSLEGAIEKIEKDWDKDLEKLTNLGYPLDGLVVKLKDRKYMDSLGATSHHPKGQIAFKFTNQKTTTKLLDIEWSFGKNCLTPVGILEPVDIGGVTVGRVSLHNIKNIYDRDIMVGDTLVIERAGDVIPYVSDTIKGHHDLRHKKIPFNCPCCDSFLKVEGVELTCPNESCGETVLVRILDGIKKFDIENLGEPTLRKMIDTLQVESLFEVLELMKEDILELDGFKEKSASKVYNEIQKNLTKEDYKVLASLNIQGIGRTVWKSVLEHYTIEEVLNVSECDLVKLEGISEIRARVVVRGLKNNSEALEELLSIVDVVQTKGVVVEEKKTICFSGRMPEKRSVYEAMAVERGLEPVKSVKKDTDYLVVADKDSGRSKIVKAKKQGVEIINLEDWL